MPRKERPRVVRMRYYGLSYDVSLAACEDRLVALGLDQGELAEKAGLSRMTVYRFFGGGNTHLKTTNKILAALGLDFGRVVRLAPGEMAAASPRTAVEARKDVRMTREPSGGVERQVGRLSRSDRFDLAGLSVGLRMLGRLAEELMPRLDEAEAAQPNAGAEYIIECLVRDGEQPILPIIADAIEAYFQANGDPETFDRLLGLNGEAAA